MPPQNSIQDIVGALFKHSEDNSQASSRLISQEKTVNLVNDLFGAGRSQTFAPPSLSACYSPTALPSPGVHQITHQPQVRWSGPGSKFEPRRYHQLLVKTQPSPSPPLGQFPLLNNKGFFGL